VNTKHRAALGRLHDAVNSRDEKRIDAAVDEVFLPNVIISSPLPIVQSGAAAMKTVWSTLLRAYPDLHIAVEDVFGESDRLVARNTVTGTHRGEYLGIAPTGRPVTYNEIFIVRFAADGRIAETWGVVDVFVQLRQLGAIPG
jgi:predicted ester cyclase